MSGRCTICDEIFDPSEIAALKCGHTFHLKCVSGWLQTSASCPVCRRSISRDTDVISQLFFDYGEDTLVFGSPPSAKQVSELSKKVQFLESELSKATKMAKTQEEKASALENDVQVLTTELSNTRKEALIHQLSATEVHNLRVRNRDLEASLRIMKKDFNDSTTRNQALLTRIQELERENASLKKGSGKSHAMVQPAKEKVTRLNARQGTAAVQAKSAFFRPMCFP